MYVQIVASSTEERDVIVRWASLGIDLDAEITKYAKRYVYSATEAVRQYDAKVVDALKMFKARQEEIASDPRYWDPGANL